MQKGASWHPKPSVDNFANMRLFKLLCNILIMSTHILQLHFSHQSLQITVSFNNVSCIEIINISALHAKCYINLPSLVKGSPSIHSKLNTLSFTSEFVTNLLESYLLNYLETINGSTFTTMWLKFLGNKITYHRFESHILPWKGKPHFGKFNNMFLHETFRQRPLRSWNIWNWVIWHNDEGGTFSTQRIFFCLSPCIIRH